MQPEDIIQQKAWHHLNEAERKIVGPLAASEGEYNVLKKMLLIAKEDVDNVPVINAAVQQNLYGYLKQPVEKKRNMIWFVAAASVIVVALAAAFLIQSKKQDQPIANKPPVDNPAQQKSVDTLQKRPPAVIQSIEDVQTIVKQKDAEPVQNTPDGITQNSDINRNIADLSTSVRENTELLSFVTEAY